MGYDWDPRYRYTPLNGVISNVTLNTALVFASGPTRNDVGPVVEIERRTNINRGYRPRVFGARYRITHHIEDTADEMGDSVVVRDLINALMNSRTKTELAMDGAKYREVELRDWQGPTPMAGKTGLGATWRITVETVDVIDSVVALGSGW